MKTIKDWIKEWSINEIVDNLVAQGILFAMHKIDSDDLTIHKELVAKELKKRIKDAKIKKP